MAQPDTIERAMAEEPDISPAGAATACAAPDRRLLELLVCPVTRGPLQYDAARHELISRAARLAYPIRDGIAILVPGEARSLDDPPPGGGNRR